MEILNNSGTECSWFCYNSNDVAKWIALASGDLSANGGSYSYEPPKNPTGLYFIRFTLQGGGLELAGGMTTASGQSMTLAGTGGSGYHADWAIVT